MGNIRKKLFLDKHYKMERFSLMFLVLIFLLVISMSIGFYQNTVKNNHLISEKALYNTQVKTSKTGVNGAVTGVYSNENHTKALVMLRFSDINTISTDAKNYNMFITSADVSRNQRRFTSTPTGGVYVFGDTGYIGLYLVNNAGFDKQILQITVRANLELVDSGDSNPKEREDGDKSFEKFDQFVVYCNPGAKEATNISALETEGMPEASLLYRDIVSYNETLHTKEINLKQLAKIETALNRIKEHESRVISHGVDIPELPDVLAGDSITSEKEDDKTIYNYKVQTDFKGALHFNWQENTIKDGYLKEAMGNYPNHSSLKGRDFLVTQALDSKENASSPKLDIRTWKMKDGRLIEDLNTNTSANDEYMKINKACQDYIKVLNEYYRLKLDYQTKTQVDFIRSEVTLDSITDLHTLHIGEDVVLVY